MCSWWGCDTSAMRLTCYAEGGFDPELVNPADGNPRAWWSGSANGMADGSLGYALAVGSPPVDGGYFPR
jgi:hypothetical protein